MVANHKKYGNGGPVSDETSNTWIAMTKECWEPSNLETLEFMSKMCGVLLTCKRMYLPLFQTLGDVVQSVPNSIM